MRTPKPLNRVVDNIHLEDQNYFEKFCKTIREGFKLSSYQFTLTRTKLADVLDLDEIDNYHNGKTNHVFFCSHGMPPWRQRNII